MKCDKCNNEMASSWDGSTWCAHCEPVDTNVKTCECGGRVDQFCYLEEWEEGYMPMSECRCIKCGKSETEFDSEYSDYRDV
jgi:hypothetical protein